MPSWLFKTEPSDYSFEQLSKDGRTNWTGVKNALALIHLRKVRRGDEILIYHTGTVKSIVGIARAVTDAQGDSVEIAPVRALRRAVPLAEIRLILDGRKILVESDRVRFDPRTGQTVMVLDVEGLAAQARATLARGLVRPLVPPAQAAETWFQRATELDQDPARWEEALTAYARVVAIDPTYAAAWNNLGLLHHRMGRYGEAGECYRVALEADPACVQAAYNLGSLHEDLGEFPAALDWYRRALELNPSYADAHFNLASLLARTGENREARRHWKIYLELDQVSPWAAVARSHLDNPEDA